MKLLIITQKVDKNDDNLGFFHAWIEEFSKNVEKLTVICLYKGEHDLPENVKVLSLGKEKGLGRFSYLINFYKYIFKYRKDYDSVFVHMNQIYVLLGGIFWKIFGKKIYLWYTHKSVDFKLKISEKFVNKIFTASDKSFRLKTKKKMVTGHGIPVDDRKQTFNQETNNIISVGRISESKNIHIMLELIAKMDESVTLVIIGDTITEQDELYKKTLDEILDKNNLSERVKFLGSVSHKNVNKYLEQANVFINFSDTGSMDKAVLEAMSLGLNIVTTNEAFKDIIPNQYVESKDLEIIYPKVEHSLNKVLNTDNIKYVRENHSLEKLVNKLIGEMK